MGYDIHGALRAGVSPKDIADELATNPDEIGYDIAGARKAGYSDDEIIKEIGSTQPTNLLGGIIGPQAANAVHDGLLAITPGSVQRGFAHATESVANTADMLGATNVGGYLHNQVNRDTLNAPTSAGAVTDVVKQGHYGTALLNLPGAVGEALPQLGASVAGAAGGAAAGAALGGPVGGVGGLLAGAGADALVGIAMQAGDIAKARAGVDGRTVPNDSDIAAAVGSSAVLGAMGRIGLGTAAGSMVATTVKRVLGRDAAGTVGTALGSAAVHGASDAAQSVAQQAAETAGTAQGLTLDPDAVASQAIIGAGTRGALGLARNVQDRATGKAASDARDAQAVADRSTWATMTPEDQQRVIATAGAGQAMTGVQDRAVGDVPPGPAARTALAQHVRAVDEFTNHLASDDVGLLNSDQVATVRQAVAAASRPSQTLTADHLDAIDALPLPQQQRYALIESLGQMNLLSDKANLAPVGGPVSQTFGLAGDVMTHAVHFHGLPGFLVRPAMSYLATKAGAGLDKLIGADQPKLRADADRAAAMLDANGLTVPDSLGEMRKAIASSQDAMQTMASVLGLDPAKYGPSLGIAERAAKNRRAIAETREPPPVPDGASGRTRDALQAPTGPASSGVAGKGLGASTESPAHMGDPEPLMWSIPQQSPGASMAQRLPRWQWVMGQRVQQDLALAGMPKNLNYAQEAMATIRQLRNAGVIDGSMYERLASYQGDIMPQGFFNLVRQQWLLNHGIDRRTLEAQTAGTGTVH